MPIYDRASPDLRSGSVTALETQSKNVSRVSLFIDGAFALGIHWDIALEAGLGVGDQLSEDQVRHLYFLDQRKMALESAMDALARRPRARRELQDRLRRKGYSSEVVESVLARLQEAGYLNDEAFARTWVENRDAHRPRGRRLLEQELRQKGVDRQTVQNALDDSELDELAGARRIAAQRLRTLGGLEPRLRRQRLAAHLARRGYGWDTIQTVLNEHDPEHDADQEPG